MKVDTMISINNKRRAGLSQENEHYFSEMMLFIRSSHVSQQKSEELLLEILDHLLEAQREGKTAKDVFGDDPIAYCEELVSSLPSPSIWKKVLKVAHIIACLNGSYLIVDTLFSLIDNKRIIIKLSDFIVTDILGIVFVYLVFKFFKNTAFKDKWNWLERGMFVLLSIAPILLFTGIFLGVRAFFPHEPIIELSTWSAIGIGTVFFLISLWSMRHID
jgi:uncharacterized membrane-anchored protein